jgi:uncharacterized protein (DUF3820 family)
MNDSSLMEFGIHKGKKLIDVPASYLIWLYDNDKCSWALKEYIRENMDVLKSQAKTNKN